MSSSNHQASEGEDSNKPETSAETLESACAAASSAINEFQKVAGKLSDKEARDAYARLMIGRGFDRVGGRSTGRLPVGRAKPPVDAVSRPSEAAQQTGSRP